MYIVLILILVNGLGFLLKYLELERFIIVFGFRFHLSLVLPFIFLLAQKKFNIITSELRKFKNANLITHFLIVIISLTIFVSVLYILKMIVIADPEYFYEFGISSIVDFPLYFFWNFPQFLMIAIFLRSIFVNKKSDFIIVFLSIVFLFAYELIPVAKEKFQLFTLFGLLSTALLFSMVIIKSKSIYVFALTFFTFLWSNILLFGSGNKTLIKILFAKNYETWEGFLELSKSISKYSLLIPAGITFILFLIYYIVVKEKKNLIL